MANRRRKEENGEREVERGGINVLSLFDGMSCGRIALERAGIKVKRYFASEVDKAAIKVAKKNFPDTVKIGDVRGVRGGDLPKIDLLIGGSPCQDLSFAGKRRGLATTEKSEKQEIKTLEKYLRLKEEGFEFEGQSYLFWEYMRVLGEVREKNPEVLFLLENVEMGKKWEGVFAAAIGIFPVHIDSSLVSAQTRKRVYFTNIRTRVSGLFGDVISDIPQPGDKGILLRDILEKEVEKKYYLSDKMLRYFSGRAANFNQGKVNIREEDGKASYLTSSMVSCDISDNFIKVGADLKKSANQEKANCFTAGGNSGGLHSDMTLIAASRGRNPENPKSRVAGLNTEQQLEPRFDGKTNCLTSVQKDNLVMQLNPSTESGGKQPYQQNRVYAAEGKSPAIMAGKADLLVREETVFGCDYRSDEGLRPRMNGKTGTLLGKDRGGQLVSINNGRNRDFDLDGISIRRLTPTECERLQTVPENEIICIFALCLDQVKNYVSAVEQNPKLLKFALSAKKEKLNEFVKLANQNTKQNNQQTKCIVQQGVDMMTQRQINQCTKINQKENNTTVNNAENIVMCKSQNQEAASVLPNAFINITEGRIMHFGTEELHRNDSHSTNYLNGKKPLVLFSSEIMELVKDVDAGMKKNSDMVFTSTTLSALSISSLEQMLATYYLFAKNAITGYIPNTTNQKSLSVQFQINDGYTSIVSDTQRYKMLGNGWTVDVIAHIFSFIGESGIGKNGSKNK